MEAHPARGVFVRRTGLLRRVAIAAAAATLVGVTAGVGAHLLFPARHSRPAAFPLPELHGQASWPPGARPAPLFTLPDVLGGTTSLSSFRGHTILIAFLDSRCRPHCPFVGRAIAYALETLPAAAQPPVIVVSTDPTADRAASVRSILRGWHVPGWHWLTGTRRQLAKVWRAYGIDGSASAVYLVDSQRYERAGYLAPILPNFLALDIRRIEADQT